MIEQRYKGLYLLLNLFPFILWACFFQKLPAQIATHFGPAGQPDSYAPRVVVAALMPASMLAFNVLLVRLMNRDTANRQCPPQLLRGLCWGCLAFSTYAQLATLRYALHTDDQWLRPMYSPVLMGMLFLVVGNYLPKCAPNHTVGIRLPFTLHSRENWRRTHRLAGFLWVLAGLQCIGMGLVGQSQNVFYVVLFMGIAPSLYSFILYLKGV